MNHCGEREPAVKPPNSLWTVLKPGLGERVDLGGCPGSEPKDTPAASSVLLYIMYRSEHRAALKKT